MAVATAGVEHRRAPLVTKTTAIHAAEIAIGATVLILALQWILQYSLLDVRFWNAYGRFFSTGLVGTMTFLALVIPISTIVGFFMGWARVSRFRFLSWPATAFVDFFRGVPVLVLVIFAFLFGADLLPQLILDRFFAGLPLRDISVVVAAIAIGMHSAAYQAEIFRAGFQSIPKGQVEAAQALGLKSWQSMRFVILPQTFRLSLPPLGNELAVVIKDTSLLAAVAGGELVGKSMDFRGVLSFTPGFDVHWLFAVWTAVAIVYFVMTFAVTRVLRLLERRYHTPGLEAVSL